MNAFYTQTVPATAQSPSELIPAARNWAAKVGAAVRRALEAAGRANARRELMDLAARYEGCQPGFAQELRIAAQRVEQG